jgi:hypothetical protein
MSRSRVLFHMVRTDFLERVRRYSFLLTLGFFGLSRVCNVLRTDQHAAR